MNLVLAPVLLFSNALLLAEPPRSQTVKFETSDGVTIEADYYPPAVAGDEKAPVAILIHMFPADRKSWAPLVPGLREGDAKFAVLAYDIRGQGGSVEPKSKSLSQRYSQRDPGLFREAWRDVEAAKQWLARQPNCDTSRIILIGASVGCSISLDYAGRDQDVKAIVCLSPGTKYMDLDSMSHIKKCGLAEILLIAPEGEYAAVEELVKASDGKAKGSKFPGGQEWHGTKMLNEKYKDRATVQKSILAHVTHVVAEKPDGESKEEASKPENHRSAMARAAIGRNGSTSMAVELFRFNTGDWPACLRDLVEKPADEAIAMRWRGPYLKGPEGLKDPWGHDFRYKAGDAAAHNKGEFDLWSAGPDGKDGTSDDITNWQ